MKSAIKGIIVEIGGNTSGLQKALTKVERVAASLSKELRGVNSLLKLNPSNTTLLAQKQEILKANIKATSEELERLKSVQKQYIQSGKDLNTPEYRELQREIIRTENQLNSLEKEQKKFGSVAAQVISEAGKKIETFGTKIENAGKKLSVVSASAAATLIGITKVGMDFESAWTGVTKTVDGTDEELATVRKSILNLAKTTGTSSKEIAGVAEAAGQLGVGVNDISNFTETMVRLGDSTNLSAEEASTSIAQLYNIMNKDLSTVGNFGSALVALGNNSATSEAKIMEMTSRIAASGSQVGLTAQQVLALSASLASVGLEAEGGGSAISQVMTQIDKDVALNSKNLKTWAKTSGMSVKDFSNLWKTDTMSALQAVIKGMGETTDAGGNLNVLLDKLGITSIRQTDTMKRLSNASDLLNKSLNIANSSWEENKALTEESQKRYDTTAAKLGQIKETLKEVAISLAEVVLPIVQEWAEKLKNLIEKFTNLDDGTKKTIVNILLFTAALAPVLIVVGKLIIGVGKILQLAPTIVSAISGIKAAMSVLFTFLAAHPVVLIIAAVIAIIVVLWNKCEWFRNGVINIANKIKEVVIKVYEILRVLFTEKIPNAFNMLVTTISGIKDNIVTFFTVIIPEAFNNFITRVSEFVTLVIEWFKNMPFNLGMIVGEMIGHIIKFGMDAWNWVTIELPQIINGIITWFQGLPGKIWIFLVDIVSKIVTWGINVYNNAVQWISQTVKSVIDFFSQLPSRIWNFLVNVVQKVVEFGINAVQKMTEAAQNIYNAIVNKISEIPGRMLDVGRNIVEGLWNGICNAKDWIIGKVGEFASGILEGMKTALGIHSPSKLFRDEVGKNIALGIGEGFTKNIKNVTKSMQGQLSLETENFAKNIGIVGSVGSGSLGNQGNATISINFYPQKMTDAELNNAVNYINRRFGMVF